MNRNEKKSTVAALREEFNNANTVVLFHYRGLTVDELTTLRNNMRELGASVKVSKNKLSKIAVKETQYESLSDLFKGPTAIAFSSDPVAAAKGVVEFAKKNENLTIIGGAANDDVMSEDKIRALASMPSLDELRAKLISMINTPATRIAGVLAAPGAQIARVLSAYSQKSESN